MSTRPVSVLVNVRPGTHILDAALHAIQIADCLGFPVELNLNPSGIIVVKPGDDVKRIIDLALRDNGNV
jgi:ABC-type Fe3+-hydroxamate transport system substrate-binding protein